MEFGAWTGSGEYKPVVASFYRGSECQILNVGFSTCFVKQRWPIEGIMQEDIKTVLGRLP